MLRNHDRQLMTGEVCRQVRNRSGTQLIKSLVGA